MNRLENIIHSFKSATSNFKAFLHEQQWREALTFLFFVLLSFGFWIIQSLQEEYEINISIPVRYKNIPPDITFVQTPPDKVVARVRDRGNVLLNYSLGKIFSSIDINMQETTGRTGYLHVQQQDVREEIVKQLSSSTILQSFEPQLIDVHYSQRAHKPVPVTFNGSVTTEPGFAVSGEINISPSNVELYTNQENIDSLSIATTVYTEIKNANKTIERIIKLERLEGANFEPDMVTITIPIEEFTEKTFEIPITFLRVPINYTIRAFPSIIKVNAFIPVSRYRDLTSDEFAIEIDYRDLEENLSGIVEIQLTKKPEWVETATLQPDKIEFIFEQRRRND